MWGLYCVSGRWAVGVRLYYLGFSLFLFHTPTLLCIKTWLTDNWMKDSAYKPSVPHQNNWEAASSHFGVYIHTYTHILRENPLCLLDIGTFFIFFFIFFAFVVLGSSSQGRETCDTSVWRPWHPTFLSFSACWWCLWVRLQSSPGWVTLTTYRTSLVKWIEHCRTL